MATLMADQVLDCTGLACPLPIIRTKKAVDGLATGQVLKLIATDPGSVPDVDAWTRRTGHQLVSAGMENGKHVFYIRKTR